MSDMEKDNYMRKVTDINEDERKYWAESFSTVFRKCPYCEANWSREFTENIFVNFCPKCGERVFKERDKEEENNERL